MFVTVAVTLPVFPARSLKVNTKLPFPVNKYPVAFCHITVSLNPVTVAYTLPLVNPVVEYAMLAVGAMLSKIMNEPLVVPVTVSPVSPLLAAKFMIKGTSPWFPDVMV